jgi:hypothetical protein
MNQPTLPPPTPILQPLSDETNWTWGRPNRDNSADATFSWLFVPLIRCSLGLDEHGGKAALIAGDRWATWVDAYTADFKARAIDRDSLPFSENGYIDGTTQEQLLLGPLAGGHSNVPDAIEGALTTFAINTHATFMVSLQTRSVGEPAQQQVEAYM